MNRILPAILALVMAVPVTAQQATPRQKATKKAPQPTAQPSVFDRGCGDDQGVDRCDSAQHRRMYGLYGTQSPEELLQQGVTLRRAMFVDGYGADVVSISFFRRPGTSPVVEVTSVALEGETPRPPLLAPVSNKVWSSALERSEFFDQRLEREAEAERRYGRVPAGCLHAWFFVVEAVDAPRVEPGVMWGTGSDGRARDPRLPVEVRMTKGALRKDSESACTQGLARDYAWALADFALAALPECSTLRPEMHRGAPYLLRACHRLEGDRLAAGEAQGTIERLVSTLQRMNAIGPSQKDDLHSVFIGFGKTRPELFLSTMGKAYASPLRARIKAEDPDHVNVILPIEYDDEDYTKETMEVADLSLDLVRVGGIFLIDTFSISPRRTVDKRR